MTRPKRVTIRHGGRERGFPIEPVLTERTGEAVDPSHG